MMVVGRKRKGTSHMYKIIIILILLVILFYMVRRAARAWIEHRPEEATPGKDVMIQDPVCKVYVAAGSAVTEEVSGQRYYFCSQDCAKHFRREGKT
jgi:YHS domain-containing protein